MNVPLIPGKFRQLNQQQQFQYVMKFYHQTQQQTELGNRMCNLAANGTFHEFKSVCKRHNCNFRNHLGQTPLMLAVKAASNAYKCCEYLLLICDSNVNGYDAVYHNNAIHYAAMFANDPKIVQLLASRSPAASLNAQNCNGNTPMMEAIKITNAITIQSKMANVMQLLQCGANIFISNKEMRTAIDIADQLHLNDLVELLQYLTKRYPSHPTKPILSPHQFWRLNAQERMEYVVVIFHQTEQQILEADKLCKLAHSGKLRAVMQQINSDNCNWRNHKGETPLMLAVKTAGRGGYECCRYLLLRCQADMQLSDCIFNNTPLHHAAGEAGDERIVQLLTSLTGINLDAQNFRGDTPLLVAAEARKAANVETLIRRGANIYVKNDSGMRLAHIIDAMSLTEIGTILKNLTTPQQQQKVRKNEIEFGPEEFQGIPYYDRILLASRINQQTEEQTIKAGKICSYANFGTLNKLCQHANKQNCNLKNCQGQTALMLAVQADKDVYRRCEHLIKNCNADVSLIDNVYQATALHFAAAFANDARTVKLLALASANVNAQNCFGNTPLVEAALNNKVENVRQLLKSGADRQIKNYQGRKVLEIADEISATDVAAILKIL